MVEDTGASTGLIPNCKVGDHLITIGPEKIAAGARIVVEAKESASYDLNKTIEEAEVARRNRSAGVCVFVHSTRTAHGPISVFARYGHDIVVRWDAEDPAGDAWLQAALMVATALSVRAATEASRMPRASTRSTRPSNGCSSTSRVSRRSPRTPTRARTPPTRSCAVRS